MESWGAISTRVVRESSSAEVTQRFKGSKPHRYLERMFQKEEQQRLKPAPGACLVHSKKSKEAHVAKVDEQEGRGHTGPPEARGATGRALGAIRSVAESAEHLLCASHLRCLWGCHFVIL